MRKLLLFAAIIPTISFSQTNTAGDIFDFQVGDEFHYHETYTENNSTGLTTEYSYDVFRILGRTDGSDQVEYSIEHLVFEQSGSWALVSESTDDVTYDDLSTLIDEHSSVVSDFSGFGDPTYSSSSGAVGSCSHTADRFHKYNSDQSGSASRTYQLAPGLGYVSSKRTFTNNNPSNSTNRESNLVYYRKGSSTCGEVGIPTTLLDVDAADRQFVSTYPNPTESSVRWNGISAQTVEVLDNTGRVVVNATQPNGSIDVSHLAEGVYIMMLHVEDGVYTSTVVKQ